MLKWETGDFLSKFELCTAMSDSELVLEKSLNIWRRERPRDGRRSGHKAESEMSA